MRQSYTCKDISECVSESHNNYIDLQIVLSGCEGFAYTHINHPSLSVKIPYNPEKDVTKYDGYDEFMMPLTANMYALVFPEDVHKPTIKCNRNRLTALLFGLHNLDGFLKGYREGLLKQNVDSVLKSIDRGSCVLAVVSTNGNGIKVEGLIVDHFLVRSVIGLNALNTVFLEELLGLAGDKVASCDDLNVGLLEVGLQMRACDPSASDNTNAELLCSVNYCLCLIALESVKICIICHNKLLSLCDIAIKIISKN